MHIPSNSTQKDRRFQFGGARTWVAPLLSDAGVQSPSRRAIKDWYDDVLAAAKVRQEWWTPPARALGATFAGVAGQCIILTVLPERCSYPIPAKLREANSFAIGAVRNRWLGIPISVVVRRLSRFSAIV